MNKNFFALRRFSFFQTIYLPAFSKSFTICITRLGALTVWSGIFCSRTHGVFRAITVAMCSSLKHVCATSTTLRLTLVSDISPSACKYSCSRRLYTRALTTRLSLIEASTISTKVLFKTMLFVPSGWYAPSHL